MNKQNIGLTLFLAAIIGVFVGALDALFGRVLLYLSEFRTIHVFFLVPFLGVAGVLSLLAYKKVSEKSLKGMALVIQTGLNENEEIPLLLVPLVIGGTWLTHLFGGSAGREGVAVQIGATISHTIGKKLNYPNNSRVLLITGMAAGFGGLFQTPLTATFFAMEVMVTGLLQYDALLPALTASYIASMTSHYLGLEKFSVAITETISFSTSTTLKLILIAIIFGAIGGLFAFLLKHVKSKLNEAISNPLFRILITGAFLSTLLLLLHSGRYCGLGTNLINESFSGSTIYTYDFALKLIFTVITLSAGFQGGEVTPLFSIGASLGIALSSLFGLPAMLIAALGYAAVFGAATNTLIAPILLGIEVFGASSLMPFVIVCSIAYACNGNQTIYGAQRRYDLNQSI